MALSKAGDTVTVGADMDFPGSPLGPGCLGILALPNLVPERMEIFQNLSFQPKLHEAK